MENFSKENLHELSSHVIQLMLSDSPENLDSEIAKWLPKILLFIYEKMKAPPIEESAIYFAATAVKQLSIIRSSLKTKSIELEMHLLYFNNELSENGHLIESVHDMAFAKEILYYWPHDPLKINILYNLLLEHYLIAENEHFPESFLKFNVPPELRTTWIGHQTELFYLLFLLFNGKEYYKNNERINIVAFKLFTFNKSKPFSRKALAQNFLNFSKRMHDVVYCSKKQARIMKVFSELGLDK